MNGRENDQEAKTDRDDPGMIRQQTIEIVPSSYQLREEQPEEEGNRSDR